MVLFDVVSVPSVVTLLVITVLLIPILEATMLGNVRFDARLPLHCLGLVFIPSRQLTAGCNMGCHKGVVFYEQTEVNILNTWHCQAIYSV